MNIYAISDLHLEGNQNKPMNIFGKGWDNHFEKICRKLATSGTRGRYCFNCRRYQLGNGL